MSTCGAYSVARTERNTGKSLKLQSPSKTETGGCALSYDSDSSANRPLLCASRPHLRVNRVLLSASRVLLCEHSKSVPQDSDSSANLSLLCAGLFCVRICLVCE